MFQVVKPGGIVGNILNNIGKMFHTFIHYMYGFILVESKGL
jgi:hypothetical protein